MKIDILEMSPNKYTLKINSKAVQNSFDTEHITYFFTREEVYDTVTEYIDMKFK